MSFGRFSREVYISLANVQLNICARKGFTKMDFLFILVGPIIWCIFIGQYVVSWTQFGHWMCHFMYCFINSMALFTLKKGELGIFMFGQVFWVQQLILVIFIQLYANLC